MTAPKKKPLSKLELLKVQEEAGKKLVITLPMSDLIEVLESSQKLVNTILDLMQEGSEAASRITRKLAESMKSASAPNTPMNPYLPTGDPLAGVHPGMPSPMPGSATSSGNVVGSGEIQGRQSGLAIRMDVPYLEPFDGQMADDNEGHWSASPLVPTPPPTAGIAITEWNENLEAEADMLKQRISQAFSPSLDAPTGDSLGEPPSNG